MTRPTKGQVNDAAGETIATRLDLDAAIKRFEAELWRDHAERLNAATEAAHAALQAHLDALSSSLAVARRSVGL